MRFSTRTRYGLRFLFRLANQAPHVVTLRQVAEEESISIGYLEQIVHSLKPLGIFRAVRGVGGGYTMAKDPSSVSLEAIFLSLEGSLAFVQCLDDPSFCTRMSLCPTRLFWLHFDQVLRQFLRKRSLRCLLPMQGEFLKEESMWDYTKAVHDHFLHPHHAGPVANANAIGEVGSMACGDALRLYLLINEQGIIEDAGFETFGCASAIASSSVLTDLVIGLHVDEALKVTNKDIVAHLGGLPREKMHCSVMGQEALEAAIRNWRGEPPIPHAQEIGKLVCKCFGVTDAQILRAIRDNGLTTVDEVTNYTKAGGACGECRDTIAEILAAELKKTVPTAKSQKPLLTNVQRMQKIMALLASQIPPMLPNNAEVSLVDVDGLTVTLAIKGVEDVAKEDVRKKIEGLLGEQVEAGICVVEA